MSFISLGLWPPLGFHSRSAYHWQRLRAAALLNCQPPPRRSCFVISTRRRSSRCTTCGAEPSTDSTISVCSPRLRWNHPEVILRKKRSDPDWSHAEVFSSRQRIADLFALPDAQFEQALFPPLTYSPNQSLQPAATRRAFTFFITKTVPEIINPVPGSRG